VQSPNQSQKNNSLYLAPTYDYALSLGRELTDEKHLVWSVAACTEKCLSPFYRHVEDQKPLQMNCSMAGDIEAFSQREYQPIKRMLDLDRLL
jgi:hypothetical protein